MDAFHISTDRLDQIPSAVRAKMHEVGLWSPLENLLEQLNNDHPQEIEDQE